MISRSLGLEIGGAIGIPLYIAQGLSGMAEPGEPDSYVEYYEGLLTRTQDLPTTAFVLASEEISFRQVLT